MAMADEKYLENLLHEGNNKLTARMFSKVADANEGKSFVLSAYSVMTPLAQLCLASVNETHDELLDTIGMPDGKITKEVFSLMNTKFRSIKGVTLKTASKIYVAESFRLDTKFAAETRNTFESEVQNIDFIKKEEAAKEVNAWVEEKTNNRIKELVDPEILTEYTRALLVNAIYFKGVWKAQFEKRLTRPSTFFVNETTTTSISMMFRKGDYNYADSQELKSQIIEIPYEGDESSLVLVLPNAYDGIDDVLAILEKPNVLEDALKTMYNTEIEVHIPKFKVETTTNLKEILTNMNVARMFSVLTAKLYNLIEGNGDLFVDSATQKAFIEVNEEGAEAAAANVFGVGYATGGAPPRILRFLADHPFAFFLRAKGNTLFSGVYYS